MTPTIIDLSHPIRPDHFRWKPRQHLHRTHEQGHSQVTWISTSVHAFTHLDARRHFDPAGPTTDALPLSASVGPAAVIDVSAAGADAPITGALMARASAHLRPGDIALIRAGWDRQANIDTPEFWTRAPWMTEEAADLLRERGARSVGFDFPQDRCIRNPMAGLPEAAAEEYVTHQRLLLRGVTLIEYLANLTALPGPRTFFVCAPLSLMGADGAPARAFALDGLGL
ncbi:MAG: cyclase family protein [Rhodospirillales bacterium]|nr:cyclase family protein [Rhodospirillales bacterium]